MGINILEKNLLEIKDDICPECKSCNIHSDSIRGELICQNCGLILQSNTIDQGAEWRTFNSNDYLKKTRVGAPMTLTKHDKGLTTVIDWRDRDAFGKKLTPKKRAQAYRLRKWHNRMRVHSSVDRNLSYAMSILDRLTSQMSINKTIKETAAGIYRETVGKNLIRGRSIESMLGASLYAACREFNTPRKLEEFVFISNISKRDLGKCYRLILKELRLKIPVSTPTRFIPKFANALNISTKSQIIAIKILKSAKRIGITSGKDPSGLAAASIYVAAIHSGEHKTQREIAKITRVTEVTVRNRYKELIKVLNIKMTH